MELNIELAPKTMLISKAQYRMPPTKLQELKKKNIYMNFWIVTSLDHYIHLKVY